MTSTNDGKDVKSNVTSSPRGKSYYIELYKSLEASLTSCEDLPALCALVCQAWSRLHCLSAHSAASTHPHLCAWVQKHTARVLVQSEWQHSLDLHTYLRNAIDGFASEAAVAAARRGGYHGWETTLIQRADWFKRVISDPWGHPVFKKLGQSEREQPTDDEILEWLKEERGLIFAARLRHLASSKKRINFALLLAKAVMDRVRDTPTAWYPDCDEKNTDTKEMEGRFGVILRDYADFTKEVWELLVDIEFVLLHKLEQTARCIDLAKRAPLKSGYLMVERLCKRLERCPREKKIWKNAKNVATLIAQVIITRCMITPVCAESPREALYHCAWSLVRLLPPGELRAAAAALAAPAATARHLHTLADAVKAQCKDTMRPFVCELFVRAITAGMNEWEKLKLKTEKDSEVRLMEKTLASWFTQLGSLLATSHRIYYECVLTAFSVDPSLNLYEMLKNAPTLLRVLPSDAAESKKEPETDFGSWANDSRSQTNLVKTSETINMKQNDQHQANVLSTAILTEGERLDLSPELCQDIAVLLSGPRVKTLSWDMDREQLLANCHSYMQRTSGGARYPITDLKYLNLDLSRYQHLPEEYEGEDDVYYGIEKGYEHLVELPEPKPEEIWADFLTDQERTSSACSNYLDDDELYSERRRSKKSHYSSDELDPLSVHKTRKERSLSKDRANSKERSKDRANSKERTKKQSRDPKEPRKERPKKEKKERKERKKKDKPIKTEEVPKPASALSNLIGLKVFKSDDVEPVDEIVKVKAKRKPRKKTVKDKEPDQGKVTFPIMPALDTQSESEVQFDGLFSMDDLKTISPERARTETNIPLASYGKINAPAVHSSPIQSPNSTTSSKSDDKMPLKNTNPNLCYDSPATEKVKQRITQLLQFRKHKSLDSPVNSPQTVVQEPNCSPRVATPKASPIILNVTSDRAIIDKALSKAPMGPQLQMHLVNKNALLNVNNIANTFYGSNNTATPPVSCELDESVKQALKVTGPTAPVQPKSQQVLGMKEFLNERSARSAMPELSIKRIPKNASNTDVNKPETVKATPNLTNPQCAKPFIPVKKIDNAPHTFSRLSYMHKNKIDTKVKQNVDAPLQRGLTQQEFIANELERLTREFQMAQQKMAINNVSMARVSNQGGTAPISTLPNPNMKQTTPSKYAASNPVLSGFLSSPDMLASTSKVPLHHVEKPKTQLNSTMSHIDGNELSNLRKQNDRLNSMKLFHPGLNLAATESITQKNLAATESITQKNLAATDSITQKSVGASNVSKAVTQISPYQNQFVLEKIQKEIPISFSNIQPPALIPSQTSLKISPKITTESSQRESKDSKPKQSKPRQKKNLSDYSNNSKAAPDRIQQDLNSVMDELLAHKTPRRGHNALDMALKKDRKETMSLLRQQRIHKPKPSILKRCADPQPVTTCNTVLTNVASPAPMSASDIIAQMKLSQNNLDIVKAPPQVGDVIKVQTQPNINQLPSKPLTTIKTTPQAGDVVRLPSKPLYVTQAGDYNKLPPQSNNVNTHQPNDGVRLPTSTFVKIPTQPRDIIKKQLEMSDMMKVSQNDVIKAPAQPVAVKRAPKVMAQPKTPRPPSVASSIQDDMDKPLNEELLDELMDLDLLREIDELSDDEQIIQPSLFLDDSQSLGISNSCSSKASSMGVLPKHKASKKTSFPVGKIAAERNKLHEKLIGVRVKNSEFGKAKEKTQEKYDGNPIPSLERETRVQSAEKEKQSMDTLKQHQYPETQKRMQYPNTGKRLPIPETQKLIQHLDSEKRANVSDMDKIVKEPVKVMPPVDNVMMPPPSPQIPRSLLIETPSLTPIQNNAPTTQYKNIVVNNNVTPAEAANILITSVPLANNLSNVVLLTPNIVSYPGVQVQNTVFAPNISDVPQSAYVVNAPNMALYQSAQYSTPVVNHVIVGNAVVNADNDATRNAVTAAKKNANEESAKPVEKTVTKPKDVQIKNVSNKIPDKVTNDVTNKVSNSVSNNLLSKPKPNINDNKSVPENKSTKQKPATTKPDLHKRMPNRQVLPEVREQQRAERQQTNEKIRELILGNLQHEVERQAKLKDAERIATKRSNIINRLACRGSIYEPIVLKWEGSKIKPRRAQDRTVQEKRTEVADLNKGSGPKNAASNTSVTAKDTKKITVNRNVRLKSTMNSLKSVKSNNTKKKVNSTRSSTRILQKHMPDMNAEMPILDAIVDEVLGPDNTEPCLTQPTTIDTEIPDFSTTLQLVEDSLNKENPRVDELQKIIDEISTDCGEETTAAPARDSDKLSELNAKPSELNAKPSELNENPSELNEKPSELNEKPLESVEHEIPQEETEKPPNSTESETQTNKVDTSKNDTKENNAPVPIKAIESILKETSCNSMTKIDTPEKIEERKIDSQASKSDVCDKQKPRNGSENKPITLTDALGNLVRVQHVKSVPASKGVQAYKVVRITMSNGKSFQVTIYGNFNIDFESFIADPKIKKIITNNTAVSKKYKLNIKHTANSGELVKVEDAREIPLEPVNSKEIETIDLISDEEEEDNSEKPIHFDTEFGKYKATQKVDTPEKHQDKLKQKCVVRLLRRSDSYFENMTSPQKAKDNVEMSSKSLEISETDQDTEILSVNLLTDELTLSSPTSLSSDTQHNDIDVYKEFGLTEPIPSVHYSAPVKVLPQTTKIEQFVGMHAVSEIIDVDDSSSDDIDSLLKMAPNVNITLPEPNLKQPEEKINALKAQLLNDLGVLIDVPTPEVKETSKLYDDEKLNKKCVVTLARCDDVYEKMRDLNKCSVEPDKNDKETLILSDDEEITINLQSPPVLGRSESPSILCWDSQTTPKESDITDIGLLPILDSSSEDDETEGRTSPVMEVFEFIAKMDNSENRVHEHIKQNPIKCDAEWLTLKFRIHVAENLAQIEKKRMDNSENRVHEHIKQNPIKCDAEWLTSKFRIHVAENLAQIKKKQTRIQVTRLVSIVLNFLENSDVLTCLKPLKSAEESLSRSLKRKSNLPDDNVVTGKSPRLETESKPSATIQDINSNIEETSMKMLAGNFGNTNEPQIDIGESEMQSTELKTQLSDKMLEENYQDEVSSDVIALNDTAVDKMSTDFSFGNSALEHNKQIESIERSLCQQNGPTIESNDINTDLLSVKQTNNKTVSRDPKLCRNSVLNLQVETVAPLSINTEVTETTNTVNETASKPVSIKKDAIEHLMKEIEVDAGVMDNEENELTKTEEMSIDNKEDLMLNNHDAVQGVIKTFPENIELNVEETLEKDLKTESAIIKSQNTTMEGTECTSEKSDCNDANTFIENFVNEATETKLLESTSDIPKTNIDLTVKLKLDSKESDVNETILKDIDCLATKQENNFVDNLTDETQPDCDSIKISTDKQLPPENKEVIENEIEVPEILSESIPTYSDDTKDQQLQTDNAESINSVGDVLSEPANVTIISDSKESQTLVLDNKINNNDNQKSKAVDEIPPGDTDVEISNGMQENYNEVNEEIEMEKSFAEIRSTTPDYDDNIEEIQEWDNIDDIKTVEAVSEIQPEIRLKGIEINHPVIGKCYVFSTIEDSISEPSSVKTTDSEVLNESTEDAYEYLKLINDNDSMSTDSFNANKILEEDKTISEKEHLTKAEEVKDVVIESACKSDGEKPVVNTDQTESNADIKVSNQIESVNSPELHPVVISKTYRKKCFKRKLSVNNLKNLPKRFKKGKNIDCLKFDASESSYTKEYKRIIAYVNTVEFSFASHYHKTCVDVDECLYNWPISGPVPSQVEDVATDTDNELFNEFRNRQQDPLHQTLVDEISSDNADSQYPSVDEPETNDNMGFGERSGRVIQNLKEGGVISIFSAATLSDVKQTQPFLQSLTCERERTAPPSFVRDQSEQLKRYLTYIQLKNKVRSYFEKIKLDLQDNAKGKHRYSEDDVRRILQNVPGLYGTEFLEPPPLVPLVQVVQVGQLPVSAAAQNPVTCDPRVTQVSDASPSHCSVENSPRSDVNQPTIKVEYTELTTADLSLPLMQEAPEQNQFKPDESTDNNDEHLVIPKEEEIKEEPRQDINTFLENNQETIDYQYDSNANEAINISRQLTSDLFTTEPNEADGYMSQKQENRPTEKTDQIAHAMNAAGITTTPETTVTNTRAHQLVNIISQSLLHKVPTSCIQTTANNYSKTINAMSLQQALASILPPPLNQTSGGDGQKTQQVLHIVQGKNASGNQITLVDNSQNSVLSNNATQVLHIVQNKTAGGNNGNPNAQANSFSGLSLVDAGLQQGGNQLLHIVNTGNQKAGNAGQLLKRVNLLTNLTNVQGGNEQKMVQFVCKSADGKAIHLNAPHQRSMVLRLQPIETPNVQQMVNKPADSQDLSPTQTANNSVTDKDQQGIKSRSVYEENYAKFIQNSSSKSTVLSEKSTSLPKFNQAFGKPVFQDDSQKQNERTNHITRTESSESNETAINLEHISQINSPPLLLRKTSAPTSQTQSNLVQQIKQTIAPMNIQTMHGGVIYTRQIPVNIGGGQTINLITVPTTELIDENGQKQQGDVKFVNQNEMEPSIIKLVPQNTEGNTEENNHLPNDNPQTPQPQPVLTQMRIKLPMLSKTPQIPGARVVRPSFFQIQRNVIGGTNQPVYQQLVLTAAPPLGQQTIRLPQTRQVKVSEPTASPESQLSSSTLEQLREFDMVLEQVKERSTVQPGTTNTFPKLHTPSTDTTDSPVPAPAPATVPTSSTEHTSLSTQQVLYSIGNTMTTTTMNVAYVNRTQKSTVTTPTTSTFVRSPDSSGIADSPSSSSHIPSVTDTPVTVTTDSNAAPKQAAKIGSKSVKSRPSKPSSSTSSTSSHTPSAMKINHIPPKTSSQKPLEDEQTTQRILYILAEYKEQVENSPDKDKPAPRRRSNPPVGGSHKRKKSGRRGGCTRDHSPVGDDQCRTMGSEDSSCGTSQGDCTESCSIDAHSPQDSPRKIVRKLSFEPDPPMLTTPRPQAPRNVLVADGQTITVARSATGKPTTAVLMPANYILPVSMVKGGQQIAIVTNRGPKLLTVGGATGEGAAANALLLQRLIGPAGLKPMLARPGVRHVRLPTAALHNLQAFNLATTVQPPDSTAAPAPAPAPAPASAPPDLISSSSPWSSEVPDVKPERGSSPETEPWHLQPADPPDYTYEEPNTERSDNADRTVLVVHKKDGSSHGFHRVTHISSAALRHKYAILEHELRLQKSLSEECEDLGVDSPSASELFPEAELLFSASPGAHDHAIEHGHHHTTITQTTIPQPDLDDQIATDHLLPSIPSHPRPAPSAGAPAGSGAPSGAGPLADVNLGLGDVGIVTVSEDGMQATIQLDQEEFARSHPNTTFHSEPTVDGEEVQPFSLASGLKGRHITSTIFHSNSAPATVLMSAPQQTVISAPEAVPSANVKYSAIDNMIHNIPSSHTNNDLHLSSVLVKDDGLTRFDNILTDSRELHLSNTASAIVHNSTQVIRRVCYDEEKRDRDRFLMDESDALIGDDAKMSVAEDSCSRDATLESIGADADDDGSSPERHAELFWESNSASERSESRRPMDFSSDSEKCCKSPSLDETNSTDSSGVGTHVRLDSVIKEARGRDRSGSIDCSSAEDTVHPPIRTYPAKRAFHNDGDVERSLTGKTRAGERSPDISEVRRRASGRGVVKRGCHCCNGSPEPTRSKKPRPRKPTLDFNSN